MGEEVAAVGLDDVPIKALRLFQTPALVTSGRLVAKRLQIHPVHPEKNMAAIGDGRHGSFGFSDQSLMRKPM